LILAERPILENKNIEKIRNFIVCSFEMKAKES